jgi:hypothetical protein
MRYAIERRAPSRLLRIILYTKEIKVNKEHNWPQVSPRLGSSHSAVTLHIIRSLLQSPSDWQTKQNYISAALFFNATAELQTKSAGVPAPGCFAHQKIREIFLPQLQQSVLNGLFDFLKVLSARGGPFTVMLRRLSSDPDSNLNSG